MVRREPRAQATPSESAGECRGWTAGPGKILSEELPGVVGHLGDLLGGGVRGGDVDQLLKRCAKSADELRHLVGLEPLSAEYAVEIVKGLASIDRNPAFDRCEEIF
ncbi:hypothetical protein RB200_07320 [Streptomyces sp. PmtG]